MSIAAGAVPGGSSNWSTTIKAENIDKAVEEAISRDAVRALLAEGDHRLTDGFTIGDYRGYEGWPHRASVPISPTEVAAGPHPHPHPHPTIEVEGLVEGYFYVCEDGKSIYAHPHGDEAEAKACPDGTHYTEVWRQYVGGDLRDSDVGQTLPKRE